MKTTAQVLAEAITADREKMGVSQEQIADATGVTQQAVSGWEAGEALPRRNRVEKLSAFFGEESATTAVAISLGLVPLKHIRPHESAKGHDGHNGVSVSLEAHNQVKDNRREYHVPLNRPDFLTQTDPLPISGVHFAKARSGDKAESGKTSMRLPMDDVRDALLRAQRSVQFARQVLDDAETQLDLVMALIQNNK